VDFASAATPDQTGEWQFRLSAAMISVLLVAAAYCVFLHRPTELAPRDANFARRDAPSSPDATGIARD